MPRDRRRILKQPYVSFHGHRLRQVSRLVYLAAAQHADVVSEELERDCF